MASLPTCASAPEGQSRHAPPKTGFLMSIPVVDCGLAGAPDCALNPGIIAKAITSTIKLRNFDMLLPPWLHGSLFIRSLNCVEASHPFAKKKANGWGTGYQC